MDETHVNWQDKIYYSCWVTMWLETFSRLPAEVVGALPTAWKSGFPARFVNKEENIIWCSDFVTACTAMPKCLTC